MTITDDIPAVMNQMLHALEAAQSQIEVLQSQVATLIVRQGLGGTLLNEPAQEGDDSLEPWVSWLIGEYELGETIPACWARHSPIRAELAALHGAHVGAVDDLQSRQSDLLAWHEGLQRSLSRIREWDRDKCRTRGHSGADR